MVRTATGLMLAAAALAAAGCGLGAGATPKDVSLTVTREFGSQEIRRSGALQVRGEETAMSLLMRNYKVETRYGGGFVQSINGLTGGTSHGSPADWFYFVNGIEAPKGAAATNVAPGSRVWWDLRDWGVTEDVPAVVGSFPQPFLSGFKGKRLPVRVECSGEPTQPCTTVAHALERYGVPAAIGGPTPGALPETLRVLVGTYSALSHEGPVRTVAAGPQLSGVYVHLAPQRFTALSPSGQPVASYGAGSGLIAATGQGFEGPPIWIVTGVDTAGVERAAKALDERTLRNRYAVLLTPGGEALALPRTG